MFRNLVKLSGELNVLNSSHRNYAKVVNMLGRRQVDTKRGDTQVSPAVVGTVPERSEDVTVLSQVPEEYRNEHVARIYVPTKNSMQSGTFNTKKWRIEFDTNERWQNPTMGWGSTGDAHSNLQIEFASKEDAVVYCERNGYKYEVEEKHDMKLRPKSYSANYSWSKKTRTTNK